MVGRQALGRDWDGMREASASVWELLGVKLQKNSWAHHHGIRMDSHSRGFILAQQLLVAIIWDCELRCWGGDGQLETLEDARCMLRADDGG